MNNYHSTHEAKFEKTLNTSLEIYEDCLRKNLKDKTEGILMFGRKKKLKAKLEKNLEAKLETYRVNLKTFFTAIKASGKAGVTERELYRTKPFNTYRPEERNAMKATLHQANLIHWTEIKTAGRTRWAYVV